MIVFLNAIFCVNFEHIFNEISVQVVLEVKDTKN